MRAVRRIAFLVQFDTLHCVSSIFSFDTISKTWQVLKSMHVARCYYTVAAVGAFIFVAGGVHTDARNSIERYDPMKDEWIKVAMISSGVVYSLIEWKDRLYAIGSNKNVERYDVERNEWVSQ